MDSMKLNVWFYRVQAGTKSGVKKVCKSSRSHKRKKVWRVTPRCFQSLRSLRLHEMDVLHFETSTVHFSLS